MLAILRALGMFVADMFKTRNRAIGPYNAGRIRKRHLLIS